MKQIGSAGTQTDAHGRAAGSQADKQRMASKPFFVGYQVIWILWHTLTCIPLFAIFCS